MLGRALTISTLWARKIDSKRLERNSRALHANWTVLLDHDFIFKGKDGETMIEDEPAYEAKRTYRGPPISTILLLHDAFKTRNSCRLLSEALLMQDPKSQDIQLMLVDLRGHGNSEGSDYSPPHTVETATYDLMDMLSAVCKPNETPKIVIGFGTLGGAVATQLFLNLKLGLTSSSTHCEVSGSGAILLPKQTLVLCGGDLEKIPLNQGSKETETGVEYDESPPDADIANQLRTSSQLFWKDLAVATASSKDNFSLSSGGKLDFIDVTTSDIKMTDKVAAMTSLSSSDHGNLKKRIVVSWLCLAKTIVNQV